MINNIKSNTISKANAKKKINELNKIKEVETKGRRLIDSQKTLLSLFDDLKTISNNSKNSNNSNNNESDSNNKKESKNENKNENKNVNDNENENENENANENENESADESKNRKKDIRQLNDWFKEIDQAKSLEEQIKILKTKYFLDEYWHVKYYRGNKELNYIIFKAKAAHLLKDLDEQLFENIFGQTFAALVDKLINTIDKEEKQITIEDIENNTEKTFEQDEYSKFVVQPAYKRGDFNDAVKIILEINELLTLDEDNNV